MIMSSPAGLWLQWLLTAFSFPVGGGLAFALYGLPISTVGGASHGVVAGMVIGVAQWLVLRQAVPVSALWVLASAVGLAVGLPLRVNILGTGTDLVGVAYRAVFTGAVLGVFQWMILRPHVPLALWWVPTVAIGWGLGSAITRAVGVDLSEGWAVFGISGAGGFVLLSGLSLVWMLSGR